MQAIAADPPSRVPRADIDPAALALIERWGPQILRTARRFSASLDDAEDAYQRALEILLTKAPSTDETDLVPWIKTVVKHEAFAVRRQRERTPLSDDGAVERPGAALPTDEQAERYERLRLGAEAMSSLKPQEVRALLLRAEGYSYKQIQEITGWTYTKVNRCLSEGRQSFLARIAGIESGDECERMAPLLSALADGEASAEEMTRLRPHLRGCLACRATLREFREAPRTLGALLPVTLLVPGAPGAGSALTPGTAGNDGMASVSSLAEWLQERVSALGFKLQPATERVHQVFEVGSAQKVAAVAAATAAVAGGGTAAVKSVERADAGQRPPATREPAPSKSTAAPAPLLPSAAPVRRAPAEPARSTPRAIAAGSGAVTCGRRRRCR
jgi:RNA polymerase sigma factor (sigma-70 family)